MRSIVGIDPSLSSLGYAVLPSPHLDTTSVPVTAGTLTSKSHGRGYAAKIARCLEMRKNLLDLLKSFDPPVTDVGIENPPLTSETNFNGSDLHMLAGILITSLLQAGYQVRFFSNQTSRSILGDKEASKSDIVKYVKGLPGIDIDGKLKHDAAEAALIALSTAYLSYGVQPSPYLPYDKMERWKSTTMSTE